MKPVISCAIYTRKSSEEGLEQDFNSLHAQREACAAFIVSQKAEGWKALPESYDDGGYSGGNTERPALQRLLADIAAHRIRVIVVYKVDRLTRSLADFAKLVELFDAHSVSFVSVTQQFNTTSSMGRLTLNVLLSFAQFEREVTGERIRDKIAASKRKGMWMGGFPPFGYRAHERSLVIDEPHADRVREVYRLYLKLGCVRRLKSELDRRGWFTPPRLTRRVGAMGNRPFSRGHLYRILSNPIYVGQISHKGCVFPGQHPPIIEQQLWDAVRDQLQANLKGERTRHNASDPSLLAGLLFDGNGNRLTASHAKKGARRYRYYLRNASDETDGDATRGAMRWPAGELEGAVLGTLNRFLNDEARLIDLLGSISARELSHRLAFARKLAEQLSSSPLPNKVEILQRALSRVVVYDDRISIGFRLTVLRSSSSSSVHEESTIPIDVPVQLRRCGMALRLITGAPGVQNRGPDQTLVALVSKSHDWLTRLTSGRAVSILAIAKQEKVTTSYVTRLVYLGCLAPDIVDRILRGQHPHGLNATQLLRMAPLPLDWQEQRRLLGINTET